MNRVIYLILFLFFLPATVSAQDVVTYDDYAQMVREEQIRVFNEITPENRAEIMKVQVERFLEANRERLNTDQISALETLSEKIQPSMYNTALNAEARDQQAGQFVSDLRAVFSINDIAQCCGPGAPYIPPVKKE